ncbi:MAG: orotidine-5'-phosphate decarboxylase [Thermodesulfobacteriota bacterium]|nr:orotidine-5'-phosphate decarboxylase [Thermodesulfobacteriota bacterium]
MTKKGIDYIVFPLDVSSLKQAESCVSLLEGSVGMFKIGLELFIRQGPGVVDMVKKKSRAGIFLDLKLHDISATVHKAMAAAVKMDVDLVTVHCASSERMLKAAVSAGQGRTGVLGVTLLTDNDNQVVEACGFKKAYVDNTDLLVMKRAEMAFNAGCEGVVCSGREAGMIKKQFGKDFLVVTPGIRPAWSVVAGDDQERITTPGQAVKNGADLIVVGRPVRTAADPAAAARCIAGEIEEAFWNEK